MKMKLSSDEVVVAEFKPSSFITHVPYIFGFRNKLILTNKRILLFGMLPVFDKEIAYRDMSDVLVCDETGAMEVTKRGARPVKTYPLDGTKLFEAYLSCTWFDDPDRVTQTIMSLVGKERAES